MSTPPTTTKDAQHPGPAERDGTAQRARRHTARVLHRAQRHVRRRLSQGGQRAARSFVNGLDWYLRDPEDVVGPTPWQPLLKRDKLTVRHYDALDTPTTGPAVLLIPPLMVKPFIFDLTEERSFVRQLLGAGLDTYLVDFGEPDDGDTGVSLDDYVLDWLPAAVDAVAAQRPDSQVFLVGYCMGGLFALMHTAANEDERIGGIVTIGSPVDSHKMGVLSVLSRSFHRQVDFLSDRMGNVPGELSSQMFKLMSPTKQVTRYADLFLNLYDAEYIKGFDALSAWTNNFIDYPQDAFQQLMREFMVGNKLRDGRMVFGADRPEGPRVADLRRITAPILAFAGASDNVVREAAVREVSAAVGSDDVSIRVAPGGHMGVFAGRHAPAEVWQPAINWIGLRNMAASVHSPADERRP